MEEIIINHVGTIFLTICLILITAIIIIGGLLCAIDHGDVAVGFSAIIISVTLILFASMPSTETHIKYENIADYDVFKTDRYIKIFDKNQKEILITNDHYTTTNFEKNKFIKHTWFTNLFTVGSARQETYELSEDKEIEKSTK